MAQRRRHCDNSARPYNDHNDGLDDDFIEEEWQFVSDDEDDEDASDLEFKPNIDWIADDDDEDEEEEELDDEDLEHFEWEETEDDDEEDDNDPEYDHDFGDDDYDE